MSDFQSLVEIMARLRGEGGCEWDRAQTHASLRQYLLEEAHEVVDAISRKDPDLLREELGDLLLQILFHAQIASEKGEFDIADVIGSISEKMVRRHPHVFADASADTPEAVSLQWDHIKKTMENRNHSSLIGGVPRSFPSLLRGAKLTKKAARAGFDWENTGQVVEKVGEEMEELKTAISGGDPETMEHELGDALFALVNLARFLNINPEIAMAQANERFERRFAAMEKIAEESGCSIETTDLTTLDRFWEIAKKRTK
ncbi:MAG TPA: nucleoside triphosphate pyrophosphohydrolase [Candidatus Deferrimicrobiaceae bacterium]|nr:nucleoside triphosphate pyrophosphohydrolase [Candidatus Deferrimicrobiaceae bacterium]